ncbi:hypothetical protein [Brochothrix thermosphacta]|uniref:hypothetical protein n=1 Tax=Brochothrix thermosphacta TaxID=2756 RepID=UPI0003E87BA0|nr:hypothetical protein [Brochothrix thermosphacta]EUJ38169.1 hypothetical protein BTHER_02300 [Brochothrix thermosphacta DSM 20171 = FSL F6-1036]ODJ49233.1 hypothetical protein BFR34_06245 [Brochothrix thermosphacta DSM 20171 = FSL F6-1036]
MPITFWILVSLWSAVVFGGTLYYMFLQDYLAERKRYKAQDYRFNNLMREINSIRFDAKGEAK